MRKSFLFKMELVITHLMVYTSQVIRFEGVYYHLHGSNIVFVRIIFCIAEFGFILYVLIIFIV